MSVSCNYILLFTNNLLNYNFFDLVEETYTTLYLHHTLQTNDHVTIEDVLNITWYSYNLRGGNPLIHVPFLLIITTSEIVSTNFKQIHC